jgi:hypothetical protein
VSPVKYEAGFCIQEDDILHSHRREDLKSDMWAMFHDHLLTQMFSLQLTVRWNCGGTAVNHEPCS